MPATSVPLLEARGITKRYGSVHALRGADLTLYPGEVLGLVGDNGAGKSTMVNILSGATTPTQGEIVIEGKTVKLRDPLDARANGIETVYQDLALAADLSICTNLFAGRELLARSPLRWIGWLDNRAMEHRAAEDLQRTRIRIGSVKSIVRNLSGGQRQAVAVARAVAWGSRIVILDEPTAALGVEQQSQVARLVKAMASQGISVILVTHNLPQVKQLCDRASVMFQGRVIVTLSMASSDLQDLVGWITGANAGSAMTFEEA